jgi:hypothetical protein
MGANNQSFVVAKLNVMERHGEYGECLTFSLDYVCFISYGINSQKLGQNRIDRTLRQGDIDVVFAWLIWVEIN